MTCRPQEARVGPRAVWRAQSNPRVERWLCFPMWRQVKFVQIFICELSGFVGGTDGQGA